MVAIPMEMTNALCEIEPTSEMEEGWRESSMGSGLEGGMEE
jgi:hypothetical protein